MGTERKALTVSEYVWLTDTIADLHITAANAEAAILYGYDRPEQLIGRYMSQVVPKEDLLRGCIYSLARQRGIDVPSEYVAHIQQANGDIIPVEKKIYQVRSLRATLFVTFLERVTEEPRDELPLLETLGMTEADIIAWRGVMNVAEVEEMMSERLDLSGKKGLTPSMLHNILSALHKSSPKIEEISNVTVESPTIGPPIAIGPGESRELPNAKWLHRCGKCSHIWQSDQREPAKCARQRDDQVGVKCGTSLWRQLWPDFFDNATNIAGGIKLV